MSFVVFSCFPGATPGACAGDGADTASATPDVAAAAAAAASAASATPNDFRPRGLSQQPPQLGERLAAPDTGVCEQKHPFCASPCPTIQQRKLPSSP